MVKHLEFSEFMSYFEAVSFTTTPAAFLVRKATWIFPGVVSISKHCFQNEFTKFWIF